MRGVNANSLPGQVAIITGAGRGIGAAIARKLAGLEAVTVLCGRKRAPLESTAAAISLVNNAGVGGFGGPLHELPPPSWDNVLNTNLRGVYYCIRSFAPMMIRARTGHIVNISSLAGKNALPNGAAYAASKWGLNGLSYSVAEELRGYNIRVSVVCPGSVHTELSPHEGKDTKKMLRPEDVAHVVAMLVTQAPQSFASEVLLRPTLKP